MAGQEEINKMNVALVKSLRVNKKRAEFTKQEMARKVSAEFHNGICSECGHKNGYEAVVEDDRQGDRVRLQYDCEKCGYVTDAWTVSLDC